MLSFKIFEFRCFDIFAIAGLANCLNSILIENADRHLVFNHLLIHSFQGWTCSLGVFPVSIKIADFVNIAKNPQTIIEAEEIKKQVL